MIISYQDEASSILSPSMRRQSGSWDRLTIHYWPDHGIRHERNTMYFSVTLSFSRKANFDEAEMWGFDGTLRDGSDPVFAFRATVEQNGIRASDARAALDAVCANYGVAKSSITHCQIKKTND